MSSPVTRKPRRDLSRRAFLRGAAGVSVALPFLESLPHRSAWAADENPIFALFVCGMCGVVRNRFFPPALGPLRSAALAQMDRAISGLSAHADRLLFVSGIDWSAAPTNDAHISGCCIALSGSKPQLGGTGLSLLCEEATYDATCTMASGPSADAAIAAKVHPDQLPLVLATGNGKNGYAAERLSFKGPGQLLKATYSPYELYQQLVGLAAPDGSMTAESEAAARRLLASRTSVHDLVREDLADLMRQPRLSSADRQRLDLHLQSIRDAEITMGGMGNEAVQQCSLHGLDIDALEALKDYRWDAHQQERIGQLHLSLVALAFACNYRRAASLQWGDPYDHSIYDVPSNERGWNLTFVSHRAQSDSATGDDLLAGEAHAEIDAVRMRSLAAGLDHFVERGLADRSFVMWTNAYGDGLPHSYTDVPHVIWGNPGGYLKQAQFVDAGGVPNNLLLNTLVNAAIQDTGEKQATFGDGPSGELDAIRA